MEQMSGIDSAPNPQMNVEVAASSDLCPECKRSDPVYTLTTPQYIEEEFCFGTRDLEYVKEWASECKFCHLTLDALGLDKTICGGDEEFEGVDCADDQAARARVSQVSLHVTATSLTSRDVSATEHCEIARHAVGTSRCPWRELILELILRAIGQICRGLLQLLQQLAPDSAWLRSHGARGPARAASAQHLRERALWPQEAVGSS